NQEICGTIPERETVNCEYWRNQVALHVEEDLSPPKSRLVKRHLDTCPACQQFARDLSQSQAILKSLRHEAINGRVFEAIQERVIGEFVARKASGNYRWWPPALWNWRWTGALSMGLLLLLGGLVYWNFESPGERPNGRPGKLRALSKDTSNGER